MAVMDPMHACMLWVPPSIPAAARTCFGSSRMTSTWKTSKVACVSQLALSQVCGYPFIFVCK